MRKITTIIAALMILSKGLQAQAYEGKTEYQKKDEEAIIIEFPYKPSIVEGALVEILEKMGHKARESKGFRAYKGIAITEISKDNMDYILRVERKSRKDKDESVVYLILKTTGTNPLSVSSSSIKDNAKTFLNGLAPQVEAYNLEQEIIAQEDLVQKAEKKFAKLQDDQRDMERKIKKLEEDLEENKKDQERQKDEVEKQKQVLEAMKGKRKA
jgi:hypothetical protein